jgi:hypothetical protein
VIKRRDMPKYWNYRIVHHKDKKTGEVWFAVHEVHYNSRNCPVAMSATPTTIVGGSAKSVRHQINLARQAFRRGVFFPPANWSVE